MDIASRKTGKLVRKALLFPAAKERRNELAMRLLIASLKPSGSGCWQMTMPCVWPIYFRQPC